MERRVASTYVCPQHCYAGSELPSDDNLEAQVPGGTLLQLLSSNHLC